RLLDAASAATSLTFSGSTGTLELNTSGALTLTNALAVGANTVKLDGASSTLTDAAGVSLSGGAISGQGHIVAAVDGAGTVTANGGILELNGTVDATTATSFHVGSASGSTLKFDGVVGTLTVHPTVTFDGGSGVLDLT